jgi:copper resistance protein C
MTHRLRRSTPWIHALSVAAIAVLVLGPVDVLAHATLVTSDPASETTLTASPANVTATFAEAFDTARSSMALVGPSGATLATNERGASATAESMTISSFGTLAAGTYTVQWTTITPDDNGIERGTFAFTVAAVAASPGAASPAASSVVAAASPGAGVGSTSGGAGDIAVPLVALVALITVGLAWFLRRSR